MSLYEAVMTADQLAMCAVVTGTAAVIVLVSSTWEAVGGVTAQLCSTALQKAVRGDCITAFKQ